MAQQLRRPPEERRQLRLELLGQGVRQMLHVGLGPRVGGHLLRERLEQSASDLGIRERFRQSGGVAESPRPAGRLLPQDRLGLSPHLRREDPRVLQVQIRVAVLPARSVRGAEFPGVGADVAQAELHVAVVVVVVAHPPGEVRVPPVGVREPDQPAHLTVAPAVHPRVLVVDVPHRNRRGRALPRAPGGHPPQVDPGHRFGRMEYDGPVAVVLVDYTRSGRISLGGGVQVVTEESIAPLDLGRGRQVEFADGEPLAHPAMVVAVVVLIMSMIPTVVMMMMMMPTKVMPVMAMMSRRRPVLGFVPREDVIGPRRRQAILRLLLPRDAVLLPLLVLVPRPRILPPRRVVRAAGLVLPP